MIKIGIIGMSHGNAHPSSWSAIINGTFNGEEISSLGFPAVTNYLQANRATLGLPTARVTHILSQEKKLSEQIALSAGIENVVQTPEEMIGAVDAIILARDDAENHWKMAKPFIDAGIPIFIDKPLCINKEDLDNFAAEVANGKFIMSCSSMRYANECMTAKTELGSLGKIELITAVGKKDWIKYGVHMLEAIFSIMDDPMEISGTFQLTLFGQQNWKLVDVKNSYSMFRDNIIEFIKSVQEGKPRIEFCKTEQIIKTLIAGEESLKQGGKEIKIS
jgi:predicted dehydrogenase